MTINSLRAKHASLIYQEYQYQVKHNQLLIEFKFLLEPDIVFTPRLMIDHVSEDMVAALPQELWQSLIFNLGLAELPSYWKCACPAVIKIEAGHLTAEQISWWQDLFLKGMGEFYYVNHIDFTQENFLTIQTSAPPEKTIKTVDMESLPTTHYRQPFLIPVGGGKDSGLTLGILTQAKLEYDCLVLEPTTPAADLLAQASTCGRTLTAQRIIDPILLDLNQQGYLNGHTPFSAYFAFFSLVIGHLFGYQQILVSNESSANQANLLYQGLSVNHQYSKSWEFEQKFRSYSQQFLGCDKHKAEYLSFLRPVSELQIAQGFSQLDQFLPVFKSCNVGQKHNQWCEHCAKCLFVYLMLAPFVEQTILFQKIFSHDLLTDETLLPLALGLLGKAEIKPLDCVGTDQEVLVACYLTIKKLTSQHQPLPILLEKIQQQVLSQYQPEELKLLSQKILTSWDEHNNLDTKLTNLLQSAITLSS